MANKICIKTTPEKPQTSKRYLKQKASFVLELTGAKFKLTMEQAAGAWDFRSPEEKKICSDYENIGYVIQKGNIESLDRIKQTINSSLQTFCRAAGNPSEQSPTTLENAHQKINPEESNNLRLHIMRDLSSSVGLNLEYFKAAQSTIESLCGNELAMQKRIGLSVNFPNNEGDVLPIHADTWNGVSPYELNIWTPMVNCSKTMCLYILPRNIYQSLLQENKSLLTLSSDEMYRKLEQYFDWIEICYGDILAFDQSLPHGYSLNVENHTHWSLNCRFKGLHTPYWDKKLGEYFMPITTKSCTKIGMSYKHPMEWL